MQKKQGISLIVLVITIIVMIILAASVVITLSNSGVIDRASYAVELTDEKQVQDLAALAWAEAYLDENRVDPIEDVVKEKLENQGVVLTDWNIKVTDEGVTVTRKESVTGKALGTLITEANYGDTVDYSVTVDGTTYDEWQIYYHNSEYVYIILKNSITNTSFGSIITVASLTAEELALYEKFRVGNFDKYTLVDTHTDGTTMYNCQLVAKLINGYSNFANNTTYGTNVVGSIGAPTIELFVAGWNAKKYTPELKIGVDNYGYTVNETFVLNTESDGLYVPTDYTQWLASPGIPYNGQCLIIVGNSNAGNIGYNTTGGTNAIRPVVCLKASIPATVGDGDYDFKLIK